MAVGAAATTFWISHREWPRMGSNLAGRVEWAFVTATLMKLEMRRLVRALPGFRHVKR